MATACANLKTGKTSNITGMNLLENIEHVMLCYNGGEIRNGLIILLRGLWWGWKNLILMFIHP